MTADIVTETVFDTRGEVLWFADYPFSKLSKRGQEFTHDSCTYRVVSSILVGRTIKTVVERLSS